MVVTKFSCVVGCFWAQVGTVGAAGCRRAWWGAAGCRWAGGCSGVQCTQQGAGGPGTAQERASRGEGDPRVCRLGAAASTQNQGDDDGAQTTFLCPTSEEDWGSTRDPHRLQSPQRG